MDLSQTKRTTIERPAAPPGLDPNPQRVVPSGGAAREAAAGTLGSISGFPSVEDSLPLYKVLCST